MYMVSLIQLAAGQLEPHPSSSKSQKLLENKVEMFAFDSQMVQI